MKKKLLQISLLFITGCYCSIIWLQSSYFNPESASALLISVHPLLVLFMGIALELFHFIEFGLLYLMIIFFLLTFGYLTMKKEMIGVFFSTSYSLIDEIHQYYIPFRSFSIGDIVKNFIGIIIFVYIVRKLLKTKRNSRLGNLLHKANAD
ncbi:VanZ family protein [Rossellomorea arthrocnemi]